MKLISWNVNGFRSIIQKGFKEFLYKEKPDIICIQETKMQEGQADTNFLEYENIYMNSAEKKGYSGTAIFSKIKPQSVNYGIGIDEYDNEGRVITLEFDKFYLVNVYTPNSKRELERLSYRQNFEDEMKKYLSKLNIKKEVIMCGDLNVAHEEIDIKNPSANHNSAGFTDEERKKMDELLNIGFVDTYRYINKEKIEYSWWSYMNNARNKNIGWRIDYFLVSYKLKEYIKSAKIFTEILGSDHAPVLLEIF